MIEILLLVFVAGVLTRIADMVADDNLRIGYFGYAAGAAYGFIAAFVMFAHGTLAELVVALMLAVILTKKINHPVHYTAVGAFIITLLFLGLPQLDVTLFSILLLAGVADEFFNNLADTGKVKGLAGRFFGYRLTLEVVTFAISAYTGEWIIFFAMLAYDAGFIYAFPSSFRRKILRLTRQR